MYTRELFGTDPTVLAKLLQNVHRGAIQSLHGHVTYVPHAGLPRANLLENMPTIVTNLLPRASKCWENDETTWNYSDDRPSFSPTTDNPFARLRRAKLECFQIVRQGVSMRDHIR